jgi:hypothetical protein
LAGIQALLLLTRWSMLTAWVDFFRARLHKKSEFVSLDARRFSGDARTFELLKVGQNSAMSIRSPETAFTSPRSPEPNELVDYTRSGTPDYFGKESGRNYRSPQLSFSSPKTPSQGNAHMEWDPRSTHARGGLGFHPPKEDDDPTMSNKI